MQEAIQEVKAVRTGTMLNTVRADEAGPMVYIHTSVMYDRFVEDGRGPVRPKTKKWLHWPADSKGPEVFTKYAGPVTARHFAAIAVDKLEAYIATFS